MFHGAPGKRKRCLVVPPHPASASPPPASPTRGEAVFPSPRRGRGWFGRRPNRVRGEANNQPPSLLPLTRLRLRLRRPLPPGERRFSPLLTKLFPPHPASTSPAPASPTRGEAVFSLSSPNSSPLPAAGEGGLRSRPGEGAVPPLPAAGEGGLRSRPGEGAISPRYRIVGRKMMGLKCHLLGNPRPANTSSDTVKIVFGFLNCLWVSA